MSSNTEATAAISSEAIVGAKRRKPHKVTQIQTVPTTSQQEEDSVLDAKENEVEEEDEVTLPTSPQPQQQPPPNELIAAAKLPNPLPPGMPPPPISSTSVVEPDNQMYTCPLCHESQATQKEFTTHIRGHNEVKPHNDPNDPTGQSKVYFCCLCGKMLSSFSSLDRHMLVHSGERPFSCDLCGQTFTTNGNMHRHKRTHGNRDANGAGVNLGESHGNARSRVGRKRKQMANEGDNGNKKVNVKNGNTEDFKCPACPEVFNSELNLEYHMYESHPDHKVICEQCNFPCPYNSLKLHKTMFHFSNNSSSQPQKSPPAPLRPTMVLPPPPPPPPPLPPTTSSAVSISIPQHLQDTIPKESFQLPPRIISAAAAAAAAAAEAAKNESEDEEKDDLADVQSMLNMAKTGVDNIDRTQESDTEDVSAEEKTLSSYEGICLVEDPIIRDMKLKGEFPCRLCSAVYPNLRALKGHNKEHLGKPPYICNVGACTYSSNDKSTLTRHMRTHTGEKPFECKLCNYGFTTKANCERHLKNKHGKTSREAIRTSIIVHESEADPEKQNNSQDESSESSSTGNLQFRCKVCKQLFASSAKVIAHAVKDHPAYSNDVDHIFEEVKKNSNISRMLMDDGAPSMVPRPVAIIDQLNKNKDDDSSEAPLDLSRPSRPSSEDQKSPNSSSIYSNMPTLKMHGKFPVTPTPPVSTSDLLGSFLPPGFPCFLSPQSNGNSGAPPQIRTAGFPFLFPFPHALAANFMNFMPNLDALPAELKDQMKQRLGGASTDLASFMQQEILRKQTELKEQKEAAEALQHLSKVQSVGKAPPPPPSSSSASASPSLPLQQQEKAENNSENKNSDSDSNYKMVIKNGVLMKKQKQRRYRTERPYSCNFCEARFTLRSNMERHIKQQHPQHWCQKPRGSRRNHAATVPVIAPQYRPSQDSETEPQKTLETTESEDQQKPSNNEGDESKDNNPPSILDEDDEEEEEGFEVSDNGEDGSLIIDEPSTSSPNGHGNGQEDLASVSKLLNTASNATFQKFFDHEDDEDVSSGSNAASPVEQRKKSAYSAAPHKIACPYCERKFPWTSSLKRHILTHTGHKPFKCPECSLWFTTKSNCDRHLQRKHGGSCHNNNNSNDNQTSAGYTMRNVPDRPYKCKMCPSSSFSSQSNLRKHHFSKHLNMEFNGDDMEEDEEGDDEFSMEESNAGDSLDSSPFRCHICSIGFEVRPLALSHMRSNHPDECASIEALVNSKMEASAVAGASEAGGLKTPPNLSGHKEGVECIFCPFVCRTFLELRKHVSKDHGVKYTCDICQKSFGLKKLLVRHKKKHDSGVSSGDDSEMDLEIVKDLDKPNTSSSQVKKKPSLMDTINKLSKKNDQGSNLDNLFSNSSKEAA